MRGGIVALLVVLTVGATWRWGSFVAGGSDSYCYVHQATRWADALVHASLERLQPVEPLALEAPWPNATAAFAPVGHIASPTVAGAAVPVCPSGVSMLMAPLVAAGGRDAAFLLMPAMAGLLVFATAIAGSRFGARVGVAAAVLVGASPVVLYQAVQPMSDVTAAALWVLAAAMATAARRRDVVVAGLAAALAIAVRPNLMPIGVVIGLFLLLRVERTWRERVALAWRYAAGAAAGCGAVVIIQSTLYGSPLSSGYGSLAALFAAEHVSPNLQRYASWLWQTQSVVVLFAVAAPVLLPGHVAALFLGMFAVNVALYAPYTVFEDWSFLRFLLPTIPLVLVLGVAGFDAAWRRLRLPAPLLALGVATVALSVFTLGEARARHAFRLQQMEARFRTAGEWVGRELPVHAIAIAGWHSGSVRYYGNRKTLMWDAIDAAWLDRALDFLRARGYEPYFVFESWEEPEFRRRFAGSTVAALDWPPAAEIASQVRVYDVAGRERYLRGEAYPTRFVR
jgi:hypothetical protein